MTFRYMTILKKGFKLNFLSLNHNSSLKDFLKGLIYSWKIKLDWFNLYRKTFKNFPSVIFNQLRNKYPLKVIFYDNHSMLMKSIDETSIHALLSKHRNMIYDKKIDLLTIQLNSDFLFPNVRLYGIKQNTDTILAFSEYNSTYENIPLKNKLVIDVGACTGDTSTFFALKGAKRVIAIEPFVKNYEILKKNINENKLDGKITPLLSGCGLCNKEITIDPNFESGMRSILHESYQGIKIPIISLEEIVKRFDADNAILKLDCEGCEYELILNSDNSILQHFTCMQIEYHNGYKNLKQKLIEAGFEVSNPIIDNINRGHILAKKK